MVLKTKSAERPVQGPLAFIDLFEITSEVPDAMGPLYRARRLDSRYGDVVVRPLPASLLRDEKVVEKVRRGFGRLMELRHPNIVPVLDFHQICEARFNDEATRTRLGVSAGDYLLVTEFARGRTLDAWMADFPCGRVPADKAAEVLRQICAALDFAHGRGVLHLDLKPQNVVVDVRPDDSLAVRVMDFSLMPEGDSFECGTSPYLAPELREGVIGKAADEYAAAILFLHLVAREASPIAVGHLPRTLQGIVQRALDSVPGQRYSSCGTFAGKVVAATGGKTSRGRAVLRGGILLALLLAAGGGAWWWKTDADAKAEERRLSREREETVRRQTAARKAASEKAEREAEERKRAEAEVDARAEASRKAEEEKAAAARRRDELLAVERKRLEAERTAAARKAQEEKAEAECRERLAKARAEDERRRRDSTEQARRFFAEAKWKEALETAQKGNMDDPEIQYNLGRCLWGGLGCKTNRNAAIRLMTQSADNGWTEAMVRLGELHLNGLEMPTNATRAVAYFRQAADRGNASAMWHLAQCLERGEGVVADPVERDRLIARAADGGLPRAQYAMGLASGDPVAAAGWFLRSARQGYAPAAAKYGDCLIYGRGIPRDSSEAVKWYARAAEGGDACGQRALGVCYDNGYGVNEDSGRAARLYRSAADGGDLLAKALLSQCLFLGIGVERNYTEAWRLARESADGGCAFGQYMAGVCCETGKGAIRSRLNAKAWYEKAVSQGLDCARDRLSRLQIK